MSSKQDSIIDVVTKITSVYKVVLSGSDGYPYITVIVTLLACVVQNEVVNIFVEIIIHVFNYVVFLYY